MKALQRVQKSFEGKMGADSNPSSTTSQPNSKSTRQFKEKKKVGEYVDFEEID
jgi:hypothetical protein